MPKNFVVISSMICGDKSNPPFRGQIMISGSDLKVNMRIEKADNFKTKELVKIREALLKEGLTIFVDDIRRINFLLFEK
jgi:hypothetical protein